MGTTKVINAAQIGNYEAILQISNTSKVPAAVQYYRQCYQTLTIKRLLEKVKNV